MLVLDKWNTVANSGDMSQYTILVEVFGVDVQVLQSRYYTGETAWFYCQMSYGHHISFDPGDGTYTDDPSNPEYWRFHRDVNSIYGDHTADWIFSHSYQTPGDYTAKFTVTVDDAVGGVTQKTKEIPVSVIGLYAAIDMQVPADAMEQIESWPDTPSIAVQTPVRFLMNNCMGKYVMFYPEGVGGNSIALDRPLERFWTYATIGQRIPAVRVSGNGNFSGLEGVDFITANLTAAIIGANASGQINIYANPPVAHIVDKPQGGPHWNTQEITFDISGSSGYKQLIVTAINKETGRGYELLNTEERVLSFEYLLPVGIYDITCTVIGYFDDNPVSYILENLEVILRQVHLQVANDTNPFPENITTPIIIGSMVPTEVIFKCPKTTADFVVMNYGYDLEDGTPAREVIKRDATVVGDGIVATGPDFEHSYVYNLSGTYYPWSSIVIAEEDLVVNSPESITINAQVPAIGSVTFPSTGGYAPRTVSVTVTGSVADKLGFNFDVNGQDTATPSIYEVEDVQQMVVQQHTYLKSGTYVIRVYTGNNDLPYDVQITSQPIVLQALVNSPDQDFESYPPINATIDKTSSRGEWIELIPGDYRTYSFTSPEIDQDGRRREVRELFGQGIKLETLTKDNVDMPYCIIYYRNAEENNITGKPWIFNIRYEALGAWEYTTIVYPERPFYDYLDDPTTVI